MRARARGRRRADRRPARPARARRGARQRRAAPEGNRAPRLGGPKPRCPARNAAAARAARPPPAARPRSPSPSASAPRRPHRRASLSAPVPSSLSGTAGPGILARGPWAPDDVERALARGAVRAAPAATEAADAALDELRERGSPSHDGLAARLPSLRGRRRPPRARAAADPLGAAAARTATPRRACRRSASCARPTAAGWPDAARPGWRPGPGAGRSGPAARSSVGENPADTLVRELREEWSVTPERIDASRRSCAAPRARDVRRAGLARRGRRGRARRRARRVRLVAGRPRPLARPGRGAPLRGAYGARCSPSDGRREPSAPSRACSPSAAGVDSFTHSFVYMALLICAFVLGKPAAGDVHPRPHPRAALDRHVARVHRGRPAAHHAVAAGRGGGRARRASGRSSERRVRARAAPTRRARRAGVQTVAEES